MSTSLYDSQAPDRSHVDQHKGWMVLEFGADWCGHCQGAQPSIGQAMQAFPQVKHWRIEDGKGRPLGRSYGVKLWPTLIFLRDGVEIDRLVRPTEAGIVKKSLERLYAL